MMLKSAASSLRARRRPAETLPKARKTPLWKEFVVLLAGAVIGFASSMTMATWQLRAQDLKEQRERRFALAADYATSFERETSLALGLIERIRSLLAELADDVKDGRIDNRWLFAEYLDLDKEYVEMGRFERIPSPHTLHLKMYALGMREDPPKMESASQSTTESSSDCLHTIDRLLKNRMEESLAIPLVTICIGKLLPELEAVEATVRTARADVVSHFATVAREASK